MVPSRPVFSSSTYPNGLKLFEATYVTYLVCCLYYMIFFLNVVLYVVINIMSSQASVTMLGTSTCITCIS